ncbi:hypothetical protein MKZ38_007684 [Zalerion maritima]|uniref:NADH-cytochrome b5 reductase n=1 Tax=Zalerion maritima TaxID=339359 RepID=A0AAD5WVH7_9PEZI|nr:hypothetical protein MKZ38_007684 [Zalerion maritima]
MASQLIRQRAPTLGTIAAASVGAGLFYRMMSTNTAAAETVAKTAPPAKIFGSGPAFASLKLESSKMVNHNTKLLRFEFPNGDAVSGLKLTCEPGYLELMVKHYPSGKASTHLHSLQPGDSLRFVTAIPGYPWTPNKHSSVTLIAGGAGITPIYQLVQGILDNPEDKTKITLVFGVNSDRDVLLQKEFDNYEKRFPGRFRAVYTVSNPENGSALRKGYVTRELLEEVGGKGEKVFVCGPPAMEAALTGQRGKGGILAELGYSKDQVHKF